MYLPGPDNGAEKVTVARMKKYDAADKIVKFWKKRKMLGRWLEVVPFQSFDAPPRSSVSATMLLNITMISFESSDATDKI